VGPIVAFVGGGLVLPQNGDPSVGSQVHLKHNVLI
jgi:hypothetical protein